MIQTVAAASMITLLYAAGQVGGEAALATIASNYGPFGLLALWFHERLQTLEEEITTITSQLLEE